VRHGQLAGRCQHQENAGCCQQGAVGRQQGANLAQDAAHVLQRRRLALARRRTGRRRHRLKVPPLPPGRQQAFPLLKLLSIAAVISWEGRAVAQSDGG
jgi:hypothetical protein